MAGSITSLGDTVATIAPPPADSPPEPDVPPLPLRRELTLELAMTVVQGVRAEAQRRRVAMGIVLVDTGGRVVVAVRMDGAQLVAVDLATDKAFTAVAFGRPTEAWAASTQPGGNDWGLSTTVGGRLVVFAGGLPLRVTGELVGGLGVSGSAAHVDRSCAVAGLQAAGIDPAPDA